MRTRTKKTTKPLGGLLAGLDASKPFEECAPTGTHCSVCGRPQRETFAGITCENGHGGAPAYEDERASPKRDAEPKPSRPLQEMNITTMDAAMAIVGKLWDSRLATDGRGFYLNPGIHAEDCDVSETSPCSCAVGYVQHFVTPRSEPVRVSAKSVGAGLTIGRAVEWGYRLDVSFEERIAGNVDVVTIHVPVLGRAEAPKEIPTGGNPSEPAAPTLDERVTTKQVDDAIAAVKSSAEKSKPARRRPTSAGVGVSFVPVATRDLIDIRSMAELDELDSSELAGAYVKVSVPVSASERDAFDGAAIKARLLGFGARAVMMAPRVVADTGVTKRAKAAAATAASVEDSIREWFAGQTGISDEERARAIDLALEIVGGP